MQKCSDLKSDIRLLMNYVSGGSVVKNLPANVGDAGSIPGWGRYLGGGNGNPFQHSCLENPMDREVWWATVHGVAKSWTRLNYVQANNKMAISPLSSRKLFLSVKKISFLLYSLQCFQISFIFLKNRRKLELKWL